MWRIADGPAVTHVETVGAGSAGLGGNPVTRNHQQIIGAEFGPSRLIVGENVAEKKRMGWADGAFARRGRRRRGVFKLNLAAAVLDPGDGEGADILALVGQGSVGSRHL